MTFKTKQDMKALFQQVSNWGRFGKDDERGTLNYLTAERTAAAAKLVEDGTEHQLRAQLSRVRRVRIIRRRRCTISWWAATIPAPTAFPDWKSSLDFIGIAYHGLASSHIDALCHVFVDGKMYNGYPATDVRSTGAGATASWRRATDFAGAASCSTSLSLRGTSYVEPKEQVTAAELDAAEERQGVRVGEGDILLDLGRPRCLARQEQAQSRRRTAARRPRIPRAFPGCSSAGSPFSDPMRCTIPHRRRRRSKIGRSRFTCAGSCRWACTFSTISISSTWKRPAPPRSAGSFF